MAARCADPLLADPTATPASFTSLASPRVWPEGRESCVTVPACHSRGSRLDPDRLVEPAPTIMPVSFAPFPTLKLRAGDVRFGSATIPPPCVQEYARALLPIDRPVTTPPGEMRKPCEMVSGDTVPTSMIV